MMRKRPAASSLVVQDRAEHAIMELAPKHTCARIREFPREWNQSQIGFGNPISPHALITASADRRTGKYFQTVLVNALKRKKDSTSNPSF